MFFFETAFIFENLIVVFFWVALYPVIPRDNMTPFQLFGHYADHIIPGAIVLIDLILNRVPFSNKHLWIILPLMILYGVDNIAVSLIRGKPIYAPLDPLKPISYVIALSLPVLSFLVFLGYEKLVTWKNNKYYNKEGGQKC